MASLNPREERNLRRQARGVGVLTWRILWSLKRIPEEGMPEKKSQYQNKKWVENNEERCFFCSSVTGGCD